MRVALMSAELIESVRRVRGAKEGTSWRSRIKLIITLIPPAHIGIDIGSDLSSETTSAAPIQVANPSIPCHAMC